MTWRIVLATSLRLAWPSSCEARAAFTTQWCRWPVSSPTVTSWSARVTEAGAGGSPARRYHSRRGTPWLAWIRLMQPCTSRKTPYAHAGQPRPNAMPARGPPAASLMGSGWSRDRSVLAELDKEPGVIVVRYSCSRRAAQRPARDLHQMQDEVQELAACPVQGRGEGFHNLASPCCSGTPGPFVMARAEAMSSLSAKSSAAARIARSGGWPGPAAASDWTPAASWR